MSFLRLPLELRWQIYELALQDCTEVTIGTVRRSSEQIVPENDIFGLPADHQPIIRNGLDEDLMSFTSLAVQKWTPPARSTLYKSARDHIKPISPASADRTSSLAATHTTQTHLATEQSPERSQQVRQLSAYGLLVTCQQIKAEMEELLARQSAAPLKINVSYPYGMLVLRHIFPGLLQTASIIHVGGFHTAEWDHETRQIDTHQTSANSSCRDAATSSYNDRLPSEYGLNAPCISYETHVASTAAFDSILETLFSPSTHRPSSKFEYLSAGIFTPRRAGYAASLSPTSPCVVAMQNVASGSIDTWCWKGAGGIAWAVRVSNLMSSPQIPEGRYVTNSWPIWPEGQEDWLGVVTGARGLDAVIDWGVTVLE